MRKVAILAMLISALAIAVIGAPSAFASGEFCGGQSVNNANKCWGSGNYMTIADGHGFSTGVCVGADSISGTCAPKEAQAYVNLPAGVHYPWIIGTGSAFTVVWGYFN
jgi:hypothetical protein